jgi:hypothetical protein
MSHRVLLGALLAWAAVIGSPSAASGQDPAKPASAVQPQPDPREAEPSPQSQPSPPSTEPASQPDIVASQPVTQPGEPEDPLRSPRTMMAEFLRAISESEEKPERIQDAVRCLDLSVLGKDNPQVAERRGPALRQDSVGDSQAADR